jgi:hypothetical protein
LRHESDYRVAVNYFTSAERAMHLCAELGARKLVAQPFHADVRDEAGFITGQKISVNAQGSGATATEQFVLSAMSYEL